MGVFPLESGSMQCFACCNAAAMRMLVDTYAW